MKSICVFCGARAGSNPIYMESAVSFGILLADNSIQLIYGGGKVGLMGVIADTVLENGGEVQGVIPQGLVDEEVAHAGLTKLHIVRTMHQRKELMYNLSDSF